MPPKRKRSCLGGRRPEPNAGNVHD